MFGQPQSMSSSAAVVQASPAQSNSCKKPPSAASLPTAKIPPPLHVVGTEPGFTDVCSNDSDRMILHNIVYTIWAMNKGASSGGSASLPPSSTSCYAGYTIKRVQDRGYAILAFFGAGFSISLQASDISCSSLYHAMCILCTCTSSHHTPDNLETVCTYTSSCIPGHAAHHGRVSTEGGQPVCEGLLSRGGPWIQGQQLPQG